MTQKKPIYVTKSFLPPFEEYTDRLQEVWESGQLTNQGPNALQLGHDLKKHLGVDHLGLIANGTLALQVAIKALDLTGEIITTPFSYVATVSSIVWEGLTPVFVDIDQRDFCIDPSKIEAAITENTSAILATHVYGHPCNVDEIDRIAKKHGLKVIYDAAHAFGIQINGQSILTYGDVSTLSFHATKVFHTGEGGAVVTPDKEVARKMMYLRNFGHNGEEDFWGLGINAKISEPHAAIGNCVLPYMDHITANRKRVTDRYDQQLQKLNKAYRFPIPANLSYNFSYYPFLLESEQLLIQLKDALNANEIYPRRYFYPPLHKLPYVEKCNMPIAESISCRMLCLPLYPDLLDTEVDRICEIIIETLQ